MFVHMNCTKCGVSKIKIAFDIDSSLSIQVVCALCDGLMELQTIPVVEIPALSFPSDKPSNHPSQQVFDGSDSLSIDSVLECHEYSVDFGDDSQNVQVDCPGYSDSSIPGSFD